jgi:hypothetical protein
MPWDTSLNKDLHDAVKYHVDMTTPKKGTDAYRRVLLVYPLPKRVVQDVGKVFISLRIVRDAKGIKVNGVGNSPGKCHVKSSAPRGGYRPRKKRLDDYGEKTLHEDAKVGNTIKLEDSVNRARGEETVCKDKWVKKEAPPSPRRPNKKRSRPTGPSGTAPIIGTLASNSR